MAPRHGFKPQGYIFSYELFFAHPHTVQHRTVTEADPVKTNSLTLPLSSTVPHKKPSNNCIINKWLPFEKTSMWNPTAVLFAAPFKGSVNFGSVSSGNNIHQEQQRTVNTQSLLNLPSAAAESSPCIPVSFALPIPLFHAISMWAMERNAVLPAIVSGLWKSVYFDTESTADNSYVSKEKDGQYQLPLLSSGSHTRIPSEASISPSLLWMGGVGRDEATEDFGILHKDGWMDGTFIP